MLMIYFPYYYHRSFNYNSTALVYCRLYKKEKGSCINATFQLSTAFIKNLQTVKTCVNFEQHNKNSQNKMKAAIRSKYGLPQVLSVKEVETPTAKDNEVLIKVHATTVNRTDCGILFGKPLLIRLFTGIFKPKLSITGTDFAGEIVATGIKVNSFKVGDKVMGFGGMGLGTHAQYISIPETKAILTIPVNINYEQATASVEGAFYALDNVNKLNPKAGQKAMVNGATGAIGSAIVQFLKYYGLTVTATCSTENINLVKSLGADRIIDYKKIDFTKDSDQYDFVFDAVGKSTFVKCKPLLKNKGIYTSTDGFVNFFLSIVTPVFRGKKVVFTPPKNVKAGLNFIKQLLEKGNFIPVIDRRYPIDKIVEAFTYAASGKKVGNIIITM